MYDSRITRNQFGANNTRDNDVLSDIPVEDRSQLHEYVNHLTEFNSENYTTTFTPTAGDGGVVSAIGQGNFQNVRATHQVKRGLRLFSHFSFSVTGNAQLAVGLLNTTATPLTPFTVTDGIYLRGNSDGSIDFVVVAKGTSAVQAGVATQNPGPDNDIELKIYWDGGLYAEAPQGRVVMEVSGDGVTAPARVFFGMSGVALPAAFPTTTLLTPTMAFASAAGSTVSASLDLFSVVTDRSITSASGAPIPPTPPTPPTPPPLSIVLPGPLPPGTVGQDYGTVPMTGDGGTGPYTWSATGLPPGLTMDSNGNITGTPTTPGTYNPTITVTDSTGQSVSETVPMTIYPPVTVPTQTLPEGQVGDPYTATLTASGGDGGPYTWTATGLPPWATLSPDGTITGTPDVGVNWTPSFTVTDGSGNSTTVSILLVVNPPISNIAITTPNPLPDATAGDSYSLQLTTANGVGPYTWSATGLPSWATLNPTTGLITGTPDTFGVVTLTVTVVDSTTGTATKTFTLSIQNPAQPPAILTPNIFPIVNSIFTYQLQAQGGTPPYTWAKVAGSSWAGWTVSSDGVLTGTPTSLGLWALVVTVTDSTGLVTTLTLTNAMAVTVPGPILTTTSPLPAATVNQPYQTQLVASNAGSYIWQATDDPRGAPQTLPPGLTLDSNGNLSGTPTTVGTYTFQITVKIPGSWKGFARLFTLTVGGGVVGPLAITTASVPQGQESIPYSFQFQASGGTLPYTWSEVVVQFSKWGLTMSSAGLVTGTPTSTANNLLTVRVTDGAAASVQRSMTLVIIAGPLWVTTTSLPAALQSAPYSAQLQATRGTPPYTWTATGLPAGLSLSSNGVISGTAPSALGTTPAITFTVTDSVSATANASLTLVVNPPVASNLTIASNPNVSTLSLQVGLMPGQGYGMTASLGTAPYRLFADQPSFAMILGTSTQTGFQWLQIFPTVPGNFTLNVSVLDSASGVATKTFSVTIAPAAPLGIPTDTLPVAFIGGYYNFYLNRTGGIPFDPLPAPRYQWAVSDMPAWMNWTFSGAPTNMDYGGTIVLGGSPDLPGDYPVTISVTDNATPPVTVSKDFTLTVSDFQINDGTQLPDGYVGSTYSYGFSASGGTPPYNWYIYDPGWTQQGTSDFYTSDSYFSGTPDTPGYYSIYVGVTDAEGLSLYDFFSVTIN